MALGRTALILLFLVGAAEAAGAQEPRTVGLDVGVTASWDAMKTGRSPDWHPGAGVRVGYGLHPAVKVFGRVHRSTSYTDPFRRGGGWTLWSWDLGFPFHLVALSDDWTPYLEVAGTRRSGTSSRSRPSRSRGPTPTSAVTC